MGQNSVPSMFLLREQHESTGRALTITPLVIKYNLTVCSFAGQIILKSAAFGPEHFSHAGGL